MCRASLLSDYWGALGAYYSYLRLIRRKSFRDHVALYMGNVGEHVVYNSRFGNRNVDQPVVTLWNIQCPKGSRRTISGPKYILDGYMGLTHDICNLPDLFLTGSLPVLGWGV